MKKVNVEIVHETKSGLTDKLRINGKIYTNTQAYNLAKKGMLPGYNGATSANGKKYIRSNPDKNSKNNLED